MLYTYNAHIKNLMIIINFCEIIVLKNIKICKITLLYLFNSLHFIFKYSTQIKSSSMFENYLKISKRLLFFIY